MRYSLVGPYGYDGNKITASAREALAAAAKAIAAGDEEQLTKSGHGPGLYLIIQQPSDSVTSFAIAGFWVVLGKQYLLKGPVGPPDREAPVAKGLLDGAVEEVWWKNLPVAPLRRGAWVPLVVLELPISLAARSSFAPPGLPIVDDAGDDDGDDEPESWLTPVSKPRVAKPQTEEPKGPVDEIAARYEHLPDKRGVMTVLRGQMKKTRALHQGTYELVPPPAFGEGIDIIPMQDWLKAAFQARIRPPDEDQGHLLGPPLESFDDNISFPISGWLTKNLDIWPAFPGDAHAGLLTDREVQTKWVNQTKQALSSTAAVLMVVIPFLLLIQWIAEPRPRPTATIPPLGPQPAMSVCSADNQRFVDEFRCQIAHLASDFSDGLGPPVCGDRGSDGQLFSSFDDLQATYCGLRDREADGLSATLIAGSYRYSDVAAAQACFNVLGYPYPYQLARRASDRVVGDPVSFLEDDMLGVQPLKDLMAELDSTCETYGQRLDNRVEGAVFATHIGGGGTDDSGPGKLRKLMVDIAMVGMNNDAQLCFDVGMQKGTSFVGYDGVCNKKGDTDAVDRKTGGAKIWKALHGETTEEDGTLVSRYVAARFGQPSGPGSGPSLWDCHMMLDGLMEEPVRRLMGKWDIPVPIPKAYRTYGVGARSQIVLDSTLSAVRDGATAGTCWEVVSKRLAAYAPVHPLVEELDEAGWPSAEQQLCGQVCAVAYQISDVSGPTPWVTANDDLTQCISARPPGDKPDMGRGVIDRLRIPWNYAGRYGWVAEEYRIVDQVCAFNLIAQSRIPSEGGMIVGDLPPAQWAGETASGSRIAGGPDGLSVRAVAGMSRFGTGSAWSKGSCGHVSLQCFTGLMLDVLGDESYERYDWLGAWTGKVNSLSRERQIELAKTHPWCAPIHPYLVQDRQAAQFDAPCRAGVEEARHNVESAIRRMTSSIGGSQ
ncbi:MAG: hypothetical protein HN348_03545 [Proteobacteria bacterium]|nr:hypothetical protein [Pseudomonadota bacterium]